MKVIVNKTISKEIDHCWNSCLFFSYSRDGMECLHKAAEGKDVISWDEDIQHGFPKLCPAVLEQ